MKTSIYLFLFTIAFLLSCKKSNSTIDIKDGNYSGILKVTTNIKPAATTYPIFISFNQGKFLINPDLTRKPVGGSGTYSTDNSIVSFIDTNVYTADFDWNLILTGEYDIDSSGDDLTLTKRFPKSQNVDPATSYATITYQYILKRDK
ncbi:hypothetical protein [Pedobacter mucosus]|uniref:hypothetical protein n=1 Tax=Pedobacter mucosus TaxID=2895286 RepID=UPI001EE4324B|nr:hypothetical protein [Pedobacter mucosus]UKT62347.1 hypothetical protein LOK61_11290 [Pedobacter mucosus]